MINGVPHDAVDQVWEFVAPQIERVLKRFDMGYGPEHVLARLKNRDMQLWLCGDMEAICVTEIMVFPHFKTLAIQLTAGHGMSKWLPALAETLRAYAQHHQCKYLEGYGRKGWQKALAPYGYKLYSTTTRCEL
ncbi:hypothetical protein [Porticoccus sp.]